MTGGCLHCGGGPLYARHLCGRCYDRTRRLGDLNQYPKMRSDYATLVPAYSTVHQRLARMRGPITSHPCVDCGRPATDYAFDDDLTQPDTLICPRTGMAYSANLDRYVPLCRVHHAARDGRRKHDGCLIPGCERTHGAGGYCYSHYRRLTRYGSPTFRWLPKRDVQAAGLT